MHAMPAACVRTIQYFMCALGFFPPPEKSKAELRAWASYKSLVVEWLMTGSFTVVSHLNLVQATLWTMK